MRMRAVAAPNEQPTTRLVLRLFFRFAAHLMFPTSLFAIDPTLGLQLAF